MSKAMRLCISEDALACLDRFLLCSLVYPQQWKKGLTVLLCWPSVLPLNPVTSSGASLVQVVALGASEYSVVHEDMTSGVTRKVLAFRHKTSSQIPLPSTHCMFTNKVLICSGARFPFPLNWEINACFISPIGLLCRMKVYIPIIQDRHQEHKILILMVSQKLELLG